MPKFLPGLPEEKLLAMLRRAPGNEIDSEKFDSPDSSAALAVNGFGRFVDREADLPPLPGVPMGAPEKVEVEAQMRFPWSGGRHPWLDVAITTATTLVGVESKRYEPFRPGKRADFSPVFEARDWGPGLSRTTALRRRLQADGAGYAHLDAAQLVKHIYGLRTQAVKRAMGAVLVYLYAEPMTWASSGKPVDPAAVERHRGEVQRFASEVHGDEVVFVPLTWAGLLAQWRDQPALADHVRAIQDRFGALSS